ncbi:glycosyltransferase family 4 protein [Pontibacter burrus]|uniref:Glycosyltransferase family 4 protein n=1 Tax=Pontibacter burrus TaxID=2704466 RepID=A0A6B3LQZ1_9BACT|nr:glycosyltransferase family 4 protein [Pontibacter burrus]NEM98263.1 glycosyltransferase family 4 protein [Pontibacter burrus]
MKVLFIVPYPEGKAASQRYRVEQWLPVLKEQQINYRLVPFWDDATYSILYKSGNTVLKLAGLAKSLLNRVKLLFELRNYNYVFIHREATPVGPPWFEWLAAKLFLPKIIFDFDDAIWLANTTESNSIVANYKWHSKTTQIIKWSYKVSCGNHYLQQYALKHNTASFYVPTIVDTNYKYQPLKDQRTPTITIGWIGSHSTLPYLKLIEPVLQQLEQNYSFEFIVIADQKPDIQLKSLRFIPWSEDTEVDSLLQVNIGVMPLPDTEWAKGKCAFKAIQYMALGIPAVVSAVGANTLVVPNEIAGFTCSGNQKWYERLEQLLQDAQLRAKLGRAGKLWVEQNYSIDAKKEAFLKLFT